MSGYYPKLGLCFIAFIMFLGCQKSDTGAAKMLATDHLFAQRAYPYGKVDVKAYQKAVFNRNSKFSLAKGPFDDNWSPLGPVNVCGRITDLELTASIPPKLYAAAASGGVYVSENNGFSWLPLFDEEATLAIGDIALSSTDPNRIYVGTGEANAGGASIAYDGLGVFRSDDAGDSWMHSGLEDVGSIGKIVIDPVDDDIAFVAAMGTLFKNNSSRGIFRTLDAGTTWENVLFLSDSTGGIDLAIHPQDGNIVYAAMWERVRSVYDRQYGGATSGIYRSSDGGDTWNELTAGLPSTAESKGRIGLAISQSEPNILYAFYANASGTLNGIYKTTDGGDTWNLIVTDLATVSFNWWFGKIYVHPRNPDDLYLTNLLLFRSQDGGKTWNEIFEEAHVDHHAMAIHPDSTDLVFNGNDGGVYQGIAPDYVASMYRPGMDNTQFYTCEIDPSNSSTIYGGTQDNGILRSTDETGNWEQLIGGDGFHIEVDPRQSEKLYLELFFGSIRTSDDQGASFDFATNGLEGVFNFNTPLVMDPNNPDVLYTGGSNLFRFDNIANRWVTISPELIRDDNPTGQNRYGTITSIDVSTHDSKVIYIGTDDGNIWVTTDGGQNYKLLSDDLPHRWVTSVKHDPHDPAGVYVSFSGFRFGEFSGQIYYSSDYGDTWVSIGETLPDLPINDIQIDPTLENTAYIATDIGVYYTADSGSSWYLLGGNMPIVSVQDLDIHDGDRLLGAATFGKGMWTYDLPSVVATAESNAVKLKLYPNPVSDWLTIEGAAAPTSISVFDVNGRLVTSVADQSKINLQSLDNSIYQVQVKIGEEIVARKVVKQD